MKKRELKKIFDSKSERFKLRKLENKDFRGLDLEDIPRSAWGGVIQYSNCNFDNTDARIFVKEAEVDNCSFKNCQIFVINSYYGKNVFENCDLSEADIWVDSDTKVEFKNCKLPNYLKTLYAQARIVKIDINSLLKSPGVIIDSKILSSIIHFSLPNQLHDLETIEDTNNQIIELIKEKDKEGNYYKLVTLLSNFLNQYQMYTFLSSKKVSNVVFENVDFGNLDANTFSMFSFSNCTFKNCKFRASVNSLFVNTTSSFSDCHFENNLFENLNYKTFLDINDNRFLGSPITFRKNLYVELGRLCNAKCTFCRNNSFDGCKFDIEKVLETLRETTQSYRIDDIVLGGGEPTLFQEEIYKARRASYSRENIYIFTNGSADINFYQNWLRDSYDNGLNISRHAVSDEENAAILGIKDKDAVSISKIKPLLDSSQVTLCATCFKGALDTKEKIIKYLIFAQEQGARRVLLSTLHKDSSAGENASFDDINIDDSVFPEVIKCLQDFGFSMNTPIYSNGGYISTSLESGGFTVVLKQYITKKELDEKWKLANKRTIDLSIDPSGVLYGNWHQRDDGIIVPEEKPMSLRMK